MLPKNLAKALESAGGGGRREHSPSPLFSSYFGFSFHHIGADIHLVKKFIWVFSITSYEKVQMNFLTNPIQCPGRKWQPTPVFLPGKFHGQRCLVGYSPWGRKETRLRAHTQTHTHKLCLRAICSLRPPECWSSLENLKADRHLRSASHWLCRTGLGSGEEKGPSDLCSGTHLQKRVSALLAVCMSPLAWPVTGQRGH